MTTRLPVVRVRLRVVVMDVREILAGHVQEIRKIVIASREHDVPRMANASHPFGESVSTAKTSVSHLPAAPAPPASPAPLAAPPDLLLLLPLNLHHPLFEGDLQIEGVDDAAVIAERLGASRLLERRDERQSADLEELGRREEHHLRWKTVNGVDQRSLFQNLVVEAVLLWRRWRPTAPRARAHDDEVPHRHPFIVGCRSS